MIKNLAVWGYSSCMPGIGIVGENLVKLFQTMQILRMCDAPREDSLILTPYWLCA